MKILHICMAQYSNGWTYQENLLAKHHRLYGYEVTVLTSMYCYDEGKLVKDEKESFIDVNDVRVIRLEKKSEGFLKKMPSYRHFKETLDLLQPDIIFSHGCQYVDIDKVIEYIKEHPNVKLYVDNHADFSNSATNFFSKELLHKRIWKHYAQRLIPYTEVFWGVMPSRVDFLQDIYKIPQHKTDLLVMGADDEYVKKGNEKNSIDLLRNQYKVAEDDFLVVTGGKIDSAKKQTISLVKAIKELEEEHLKIIVFGSIADDIKDETMKLFDGKQIIYAGWIEPELSYNYFAIADLVVFPGRHSVFWEQVVGQGRPMLVKDWPGTHHVNINGNVEFIKDDTIMTIKQSISSIYNDHMKYEKMKEKALAAMKYFSYAEIAKKV